MLPSDFCPEEYLRIHPDVRLAGIDPAQHYLAWGISENRSYKRDPAAVTPIVERLYQFDGLASKHNHDFMSDPRFIKAYARGVKAARGADYKWYWRVHMGLWAARTAARHEGDFVECGVNYGVLSSAIMEDLDWNNCSRKFYLLDTYAGVDDRYLSDQEKISGATEKNRKLIANGFYTSNIDSVRENFAEWPNAVIVQGSIPDTLVEIKSSQIAFLHIDLNCTLPEVAAIEHLWERLVPGAVVLLDDYAYYGYHPQKEGMDEWASRANIAIASLPTGQGLLIKP
ncbi:MULTISPECIES: class I SAM-dependent methyltransferase [Pseudomonas]|uniref:Class I SAM-dependent methyltransferase n=1 Tax=Pseudomonas mosselii TaxID=78327 RepID=A0A5R8YWL5_9PSED|nr:class I SAM-dependent methyltransferase [Pseudomonas mosselii]TLP57475.1 class I SAM-dependent methyltransferase [Pseudomonas mosselii]